MMRVNVPTGYRLLPLVNIEMGNLVLSRLS